jgi:hypothetical protein
MGGGKVVYSTIIIIVLLNRLRSKNFETPDINIDIDIAR